MKTILILFVLIIVVGVGLGYYRGWFNVSSDNTEGTHNVTVSVDAGKIKADKDEAVDKVQDLGRKSEDKAEPTPKTGQE